MTPYFRFAMGVLLTLLFFAIIVAFTGCNSEVDKCVDAGMAMQEEAHPEGVKDPARVKATARLICLKAASKADAG